MPASTGAIGSTQGVKARSSPSPRKVASTPISGPERGPFALGGIKVSPSPIPGETTFASVARDALARGAGTAMVWVTGG